MTRPMTNFPRYETRRLWIEPLRAEHAEALQALTDDPAITDVINFLPTPFTLADAEALISGNDDENCFLGVWQDGELIGVVGAHAYGDDRTEIGYWIGARFQGQGYVTEAVSSVIDHLRRVHPLRRIIAECRPENQASWHLLHKLGFLATGEQGKRPGRELLVLGEA
jgi:RimJ/RimL family protein N-acetyltransferase